MLKTLLRPAGWLCFLFLLLCSCATRNSVRSKLPPDQSINPRAGRGDLLMVTLRLADGEELPFAVDSGTTGTVFDQSLAPKLGKPLGSMVFQSWGTLKTNNCYATPTLYLGGVPLMNDTNVFIYDFKSLSASLGHSVMGILGYDCLSHYCVQLDFVAGKMRFLDDQRADRHTWGKAFPIVALNAHDSRPAVAENLLGLRGPHSLIDSGCNFDGWLMPKYFQVWTNQTVPPACGEAHSPDGRFGGMKYPWVAVRAEQVESDGIGLPFLARHLVTLDFPRRKMYLLRQSIGPLPDPGEKITKMEAVDPIIADVLLQDAPAARRDLARIVQGPATELEKNVAQKLAAILENKPKPAPAEVPPEITSLPLGDARPEQAAVGYLKPAANRIPSNRQIQSPLLDSGKIYATGLFAHAPSRYVYKLDGRWKTLRGEAGLHTAFQSLAFGIVFVIKTDDREIFRSSSIRGTDHARYDVDVTGAKTLELLVEKAGFQNGGNWGLWLDPTLFR